MLVVFDKHVIVFSDKYCQFPSSGSLQLDWNRWYKRAIEKSAKQAWGAERWIKSFPERVFLDRGCSVRFPLPLPTKDEAIFHLVVVAHGCEQRCESEFGGRGSLMVNSAYGSGTLPFTIGDIDPNKTFVHVFNDSTLDIVLGSLDTVSDFTAYLSKKEAFIRSGVFASAAGEEDLLAFYLKDVNTRGEHDFVVPDGSDALLLEEGHWEEFCELPERLAQITEDEISYIWDILIERFSKHILNATQYFSSHIDIASSEVALRFMASESRFARRMISKGLLGAFADTPNGTRRIRYLPPTRLGAPFYVFLCLPQPEDADRDHYRTVRGSLLEAICMVVKYMFPATEDIIAIASDPVRSGKGSSEDLIYFDARIWSEEQNEEAARLQEEYSILKEINTYGLKDQEYPDYSTKAEFNASKRTKIGRNEQCPCGSGRKYKHCHGR